MMQEFPTLVLKAQTYTYPDGRSATLLMVEGTLPMYYQVREAMQQGRAGKACTCSCSGHRLCYHAGQLTAETPMHLFSNQAGAWGRTAFAHGEGDSACPQPGEAGMHQQHFLLTRKALDGVGFN